MADAPTFILGSRVIEIEGKPVFVFVGKDASGSDIEMMFPVEAIPAVFNDAMIKIEAHQNSSARLAGAEWARSFYREGTPAKISSTLDGKVILMARFGLPTEIHLSFDPQHAQELSEALRTEADKILKQSSDRAH